MIWEQNTGKTAEVDLFVNKYFMKTKTDTDIQHI